MTPLRVALAVVLAAALTVAAAPAVEDARASNAAHAGQTAADDVRDAVVALAASTPAPPGAPAATRTVTVSVPPADVTTARAALLVGTGHGDAATTDVLVVRAGTRTHTTPLPVDVRIVANGTVAPDDTGLAVTDRATLGLRYVRYDGRPTVLVTAQRGARVYT
ncbi:hypothetical protein GCM10009037_15270 [Halarchaeum grantii]|uniref:DUF7311 domain-containing protein n=1 Tax=Halarchaeum grantii TaxID=1193105 RepID=A0A830F2C1_9EURY|nr:hypothetical protein [Halarchaeum grantii]GGL32570.1 hypothetical protein GCM10009037_15270 [Halarchaeum grantii]